MNKRIPEILYHYTTMGALYAMLENLRHLSTEDAKQDELSFYSIILRASHIWYMNDPVDYRFMIDCIKEAISDYENKHNKTNNVSGRFEDNCNNFDNIFGRPSLLSLSELKDNLSMWRSYGGNGQGVALGFKTQKLYSLLGDYQLGKCLYVNKDQAVRKLLRDGTAKRLFEAHNSEKEINLQIIKETMGTRVFSKHSAYSQEQEWRLVNFSSHFEKFYEKNGLLIPYSEIRIPFDCLTEICIGPCCDKELSNYSLKALISSKISYGLKLFDYFNINTSEIPYVVR